MSSLLKDAENRMNKSVEKIVEEYGQMRTGRPSPALLESVKVDYYGVPTPINQLAHHATEDRTLIIKPWDKTVSARSKGHIRLQARPDSDERRCKYQAELPTPTTEQRDKWVKIARENAEKGKIAVRNIRRDVIKEARDLQKASK